MTPLGAPLPEQMAALRSLPMQARRTEGHVHALTMLSETFPPVLLMHLSERVRTGEFQAWLQKEVESIDALEMNDMEKQEALCAAAVIDTIRFVRESLTALAQSERNALRAEAESVT